MMARRVSAFVSIFFLSLMLLSSTAAADLIVPEQEACEGAEERETCEVDGVLGECRSRQSCRPDYDVLDEDGNPTEMCTTRLSCVPVEEDPDANGDDDNGDVEPDENGDDSGESSDEDDDAEDSSSCSSISVNSGMVPMVSFVLGAFLLIGIRRRTKRAS